MSDTPEAMPQARSGIGIGTVVRLAAIALGIASAVLIARSAFGIRFNEDFMLLLAVVHDIVGVVVLPFDLLLVTPFVRWLHEQGLVFELHAHWRNAFVLLWLYFASFLRAVAPPSFIFDRVYAVSVACRWVWAALAALVGGVLAGTVPLDHPAVLWWPVSAYFLYRGGDDFIYAFMERLQAIIGVIGIAIALAVAVVALGWAEPIAFTHHPPPPFLWAVTMYFASRLFATGVQVVAGSRALDMVVVLYLTMTCVSGALALGALPGPAWLDFRRSPSPGLINLASFVAVMAAWGLLMAFLAPERNSVVRHTGGRYLDQVLNDFKMRTALDILAVLGGAAFIVWLGNALA